VRAALQTTRPSAIGDANGGLRKVGGSYRTRSRGLCVTGMRSNQLNYVPTLFSYRYRNPAYLLAFLTFNRFACEEGLALSRESVRRILRAAKLASPQKGRAPKIAMMHPVNRIGW
jgi:hypothetical protein